MPKAQEQRILDTRHTQTRPIPGTLRALTPTVRVRRWDTDWTFDAGYTLDDPDDSD